MALMPTARMTPAEADEFERLALERGGSSSRHVAQIEQPTPQPSKPVRTHPEQAPTQQQAIPNAVLFIPGWIPTSLNKLSGHWAERGRKKKAERNLLAAIVAVQRVGEAKGRRRIDLHLVLPTGKRSPDPDNLWKSVLDALVHAKILIDDNPTWREQGVVTYARSLGGLTGTFILITESA